MKEPFAPIDESDRSVFSLITVAAGVFGVAYALYILFQGSGWRALLVAAICGGCGVFLLVLARRLHRNRSPHPDGHLVSPWLTLSVGVLFLLVGIGNIVTGSMDAVWLLPPGALATLFAMRQIRQRMLRRAERFKDGA